MALGLVYLRVIASRWRLVLALVALGTLTAWGVSVFYLATKPKFEAAARLNIVPTAEELGYASRFVRGSTFDGGSVLLGTYAEFAHTRPVVEPIVDRYIAQAAAAQGIGRQAWLAANTGAPSFSPGRILAILNYGEAPVVPLREEMIEELIEHTTIETVEGTYLLRLGVEWEDGRSAAWFANALADAIIARAERASRSTGREIAGTLESRLAAKRAELAGVVRRSRDLKSAIGVVDIDRQKTSLLEARLTEQAQLTTDRAGLDSSRSQIAALRQQSNGKLTGAQTTVEQTLAVEAPRAAGLAQSVAIRSGRIAQLDRQIAGLGGSEDRVKALDDRAVLLQQEVNALTERVSFSQTENLANGPRIQLIERATVPATRSSPKVFFNTILGFVAGCALAACALLLLGPAVPKVEPQEEDEAIEPVAAPVAVAPDAPRHSAQVHALRHDPTPSRSDDPPATQTPPHSGEGRGAASAAGLWRGGAALADRVTLASGGTALKQGEAPAPAPEPILVPVAAAAEPARPPADDERYPGTLARPANGASYTASEVAAIRRQFGTWLFEHLAADARGLFVGAVKHEDDAKQLAQLTHAMLDAAGIQLAVVDGRQAGTAADKPGKPFVYLGRLGTDAAGQALAQLPVSAHLLLATRAGDPDDWRRHLGTEVPHGAHVVALG